MLFSSLLNAQTDTREIGLRFGGLQYFDFIYKKQRTANGFQRIRLTVAALSFDQYDDYNHFATNLGIAIGREKRKGLAENLYWVHGWEPRIRVMYNLRTDTSDGVDPNDYWNLSVQPAIGYVLGFQYNFSERFYVSLEGIPSLGVNLNFDDRNGLDNFGLGGNFSFSGVAITLAYSFVPHP
ncbi:hypothetical protein CRP01_37850 [Flavilitoribacter nigricans DSM 23189 = NBRC 102662]|uniref:Outer membrane protein beta-barrel domain-containing protein n=2 Tax=Flavilitoribacter TaxID=2762562 RepID=A0A2D0MYM5_FLAN2|nr:hypothetical protein CRP01_37850 [Flavilitoribacter nigricans DSM 23189 = NBRC 102662]